MPGKETEGDEKNEIEVEADKAEEDKQEGESIKDTFAILKTKKMLLITPLMIARGVSAVMMASVFVNFWSSTLTYSASLSGEKISVDRKLTTSVYTYLLYGAGAIISPQVVGKI